MISLSFSIWELALLIIAIAFVVGTVYLVKTLKNLAETLSSSAKLIEENRVRIYNILEDVEEITQNSGEFTGKANEMVTGMEASVHTLIDDVIEPITGALSKVSKAAGLVSRKKKNQ